MEASCSPPASELQPHQGCIDCCLSEWGQVEWGRQTPREWAQTCRFSAGWRAVCILWYTKPTNAPNVLRHNRVWNIGQFIQGPLCLFMKAVGRSRLHKMLFHAPRSHSLLPCRGHPDVHRPPQSTVLPSNIVRCPFSACDVVAGPTRESGGTSRLHKITPLDFKHRRRRHSGGHDGTGNPPIHARIMQKLN